MSIARAWKDMMGMAIVADDGGCPRRTGRAETWFNQKLGRRLALRGEKFFEPFRCRETAPG
jgi:hypothetical protein